MWKVASLMMKSIFISFKIRKPEKYLLQINKKNKIKRYISRVQSPSIFISFKAWKVLQIIQKIKIKQYTMSSAIIDKEIYIYLIPIRKPEKHLLQINKKIRIKRYISRVPSSLISKSIFISFKAWKVLQIIQKIKIKQYTMSGAISDHEINIYLFPIRKP